jgi:hypothetical protein
LIDLCSICLAIYNTVGTTHINMVGITVITHTNMAAVINHTIMVGITHTNMVGITVITLITMGMAIIRIIGNTTIITFIIKSEPIEIGEAESPFWGTSFVFFFLKEGEQDAKKKCQLSRK